MFKILSFICTAILFTAAPAMAQDHDVDIPQIDPGIETSINLGFGFTETVRMHDDENRLTLDNVKLRTFGVSAEKTLLRDKNYSVSAALSGEAGFGTGSNFEINGAEVLNDADYRRLQAYGDVIARYEGGSDKSWTPFAAIGVGVVEERITQDSFGHERQNFQTLTPKTRFRTGLEKKLTENVTFGVSAGKTVDLE